MLSDNKLSKSKKRLYAPKKIFGKPEDQLQQNASSPFLTLKRKQPTSPEFKFLAKQQSRPNFERSGLDDSTKVKKKPSITKKADDILRSKQDTLYSWLYDQIKPADQQNLTYDTFKFEVIATEILECIMPLVVKLKDIDEAEDSVDSDEEDVKVNVSSQGMKRQQFIAKLQEAEIVPVYLKVKLLKAVEQMKELHVNQQSLVAEKTLPWFMQKPSAKPNKYRKRFDAYKVDTKLLADANKRQTPISTYSFAIGSESQRLSSGVVSRNSALQFKSLRSANVASAQMSQQRLNQDLCSVSQVNMATEDLRGAAGVDTSAIDLSSMLDTSALGETQRYIMDDHSLMSGAVSARVCEHPGVLRGSPTSLQSTTFLKSLRVQNAHKSQPRYRQRMATARPTITSDN